MYFGKSIAENFDINNQLQMQYYIENYLLEDVLFENTDNEIAQAIENLKKKDISKITQEDCEKVINKIMAIENNKLIGKLLINLFVWFIGAVTFYTGLFTGNIVMEIIGILNLLFVCISSNYQSSGEKVMRALMKCQAKLTVKKEKVSEQEQKEIDKIIKVISKMKDAVKKNARINTIKMKESADIVNETFKGDPVKNDIFKQILDEVENLIKFFNEFTKHSIEIAEKQLKEFEKVKDYKTLNDIAVKVDDIGIKGKEENEKMYEYICGDVTWSMFKRDVKKLRNKLSIVSFDNKRALAAKLKTIQKELFVRQKKYCEKDSDFIKRLNKIYEKAKKYNISLADRVYNIIIGWINFTIDEINATNSDIDITIKDLGLNSTANSFLFKLLNGKELLKRLKEDEEKDDQ